ncbi:MAG TPA: cytochrome c oxidase subunit II [Solirubrobacterales bacterium]|nr:cytochrome c oxidase subunit II [Solirubrobacterales bacterium]
MRGRAKPRAATVALLVATATLTTAGFFWLPGAAGANVLTPEAGPSPNAEKINELYKIVLYIGLAVIGTVWAFLFYSLFRFRARRGREAPQISGNASLELGWTAAAAAIVAVITVITYIYLDDITHPVASGPEAVAEARDQFATINQPPPPGDKSLDIQVSGQQFLWRYQYPNQAVSFHEMVVPRDTTVTLTLKANDVIHSWWIPELGGKLDAVPGYENKTWFKATETGTFEGQCAELCGAGHYAMTAKVTVVEPAAYQAWVENQKEEFEEGQRLAQEQRRQIEAELAQ